MINVFKDFENEELRQKEQKAKETLTKGMETYRKLLEELEKNCKETLDWNSEIDTDTLEEQEEKQEEIKQHYRNQRNLTNLHYTMVISSFISSMEEIDDIKTYQYIVTLKSTFKSKKQLEIDFKDTVNSITSDDFRKWLLNPEENRFKYIAANVEDGKKIKYSRKELNTFLDSVTEPFTKALEALGDDKELRNTFKEVKAYKEKGLANENFFILNYNDTDNNYNKTSELEKSIQRLIGGEPYTIDNSLLQYKDYTKLTGIIPTILDKEISGLDKEISGKLSVIDNKMFEQIRKKSLFMYDEIKSLKSEKEKEKYFNDRDNFKISLTIDEYANAYGLDVSNKNTKDYVRREMTSSIIRLRSLTLYLSDDKYKEELGFDTHKNIVFGIISNASVPTEELRTSTYNIELNSTYMRVVTSEASKPSISIQSSKARKRIKGKGSKFSHALADTLLDNYRKLNNYNTKGKNGSTKEANYNRLKVRTIFNRLEDEGAFINSAKKETQWRDRKKDILENALDELQKKEIINDWSYLVGKKKYYREAIEEDRKLSKDEWLNLNVWYEWNDNKGEIKEILDNAKKTRKKKRDIKQRAIKKNMEKSEAKKKLQEKESL